MLLVLVTLALHGDATNTIPRKAEPTARNHHDLSTTSNTHSKPQKPPAKKKARFERPEKTTFTMQQWAARDKYWQRRISNLEEEHAEDIARLKERQRLELTEMREMQRERCRSLEREYQRDMDALRERYRRVIAGLRERGRVVEVEHCVEVRGLRERYRRKIEELKRRLREYVY